MTGPLEDLRTLLAEYPELAAEPGLTADPDLAGVADPDGLPPDEPRPAGPPPAGSPPAGSPPAGSPPADLPLAGPPTADPPLASPPPADPPLAGREVLKAGFWDRTRADGAGFAAGGVADNLPPGPVLAGFAADVWAGGLARISDDELIGVLRAARRLVSWGTALELAASEDLWRRRVAEEDAGDTGAAAHVGAEIAAALTLTNRAGDRVLDLALALRRLPATSQALAAGDIDVPRAIVITNGVTGLSDEHAAAVDQAVIGAAPGQTTGELSRATRRAVIAADPAAARQRKERALREARVERWDEHSGTAALAGRDLPPAAVLAADNNLTALAKQLKAAGIPGTLDILRARVYLTLLSGAPATSLLPAGPGDCVASSDSSASRDSSASMDLAGRNTSTALSATGTVNLTLPLATWLGLSDAPGHCAGYGPLDAAESRDLASALARRAGNKWCLTITDPRGRPVAHGCTRVGPPGNRRGARPAADPRDGPTAGDPRDGPTAGSPNGLAASPRNGSAASPRNGPSSSPRNGQAASPRDGPVTSARNGPATGSPDQSAASPSDGPTTPSPGGPWSFTITSLTGGDCDHTRETPAYRPSAALRHLIEIRHATCVFPGCRRPAAQCDIDHTIAYRRGGRTCLCNLAPLCRHHHDVKQTIGWTLEQTSPGTLTWTTPAGRRYTV